MRSRHLASVLLLALSAAVVADVQIDAALRALRSDSSLKVRAQAAIILGQRGALEAVGALADAARNDSSEAVRLAAVSALAKIGDPAGRGAIEAATKDDDERVRAAAEKALQAFSGPGPVGPGSIAVLLEDVSGTGDAALRAEFRKALERRLREQGFSVVARGQSFALRPSVQRAEVAVRDGKTVIAVRVTLVAVNRKGAMDMLEATGRAKVAGTASGAQVSGYAAKAADVAARTLTDDLKERLQPVP